METATVKKPAAVVEIQSLQRVIVDGQRHSLVDALLNRPDAAGQIQDALEAWDKRTREESETVRRAMEESLESAQREIGEKSHDLGVLREKVAEQSTALENLSAEYADFKVCSLDSMQRSTDQIKALEADQSQRIAAFADVCQKLQEMTESRNYHQQCRNLAVQLSGLLLGDGNCKAACEVSLQLQRLEHSKQAAALAEAAKHLAGEAGGVVVAD